MGHLFDIPEANAEVVVRTRDHCDPHVHVLCRPEKWEARIVFSFLNDSVTLRELTVGRGGRDPGVAMIGLVKDVIRVERERCREEWWRVFETTCLENKWVVPIPPRVAAAAKSTAGARQVRFARFNPALKSLQIGFLDGTQITATPT